MFKNLRIKKIAAREILDSRGNPTIESKVVLRNGIEAKASVPSGASTGTHEAIELRDGDKKRYDGKGVLKAVENVNKKIHPLLRGIEVTEQQDIDQLMIDYDGTENKSNLGANAILSVSLAAARAGALTMELPLYRYIKKTYKIHYKDYQLPNIMVNILNGGRHAGWAMDFQECMIVPKNKDFSKRVQMASEVFHNLGKIIQKKRVLPLVGDEGGYAFKLKNNEEAFKLVHQAIIAAGYKPGKDVNLAIDAAASEFYKKTKKKYQFNSPKKELSAKQLDMFYKTLIKKYNLISIEDGLAEDDWDNWVKHTNALGKDVMLVGDDLFVTNPKRLQKGLDMGIANAILIKVNQIGSLTETLKTIYLAKLNKYKVVISHRSGETKDDFIADLAVAVNAEYIKTGSMSRSERISKYNRLLEIDLAINNKRK